MIIIAIPDMKPKEVSMCSSCKVNIMSGTRTCSEEGVSYDPLTEACVDRIGCNNPVVPCVYEFPELGTSCYGDIGYNGLCQTENCGCLNRSLCPDFAKVVFYPNEGGSTTIIEQRDYSIIDGDRVYGLPLSNGQVGKINGICGLTSEQLTSLWPPQCIIGELTQRNGLWYCI